MKRRSLLAVAVALAAVTLTAANYPRLVETWSDTTHDKVSFKKLLVIAITDDPEARWSFENGFAGQLKRSGVDGVTSYSLAPDLAKTDNRRLILTRLMEEGIDGAISVRLVPLKDVKEDDWIATWRERRGASLTFRMLVEEALPITGKKAKKFGVEVDLWETTNGYRVWAGRSNGHSLKQLRKEAPDLVQVIMDELKLTGRI